MNTQILNNTKKETIDRRVLIFPAMLSLPEEQNSGKKIHFLFSVSQIEDIMQYISVHPVPFSPPYTEGIAQWRDHVIPVISLEKCLWSEREEDTAYDIRNTRMIMVRVTENEETKRSILRVIPPIRMLSLPIPCTPVSSVGWISDESLVRAIYEWEEGYLIVPYMGKILNS